MTKKDFRERCSFHHYGTRRDSSLKAIFFDWQEGENFRGYKYCVFARTCNATKAELENALFELVTEEKNTPWYIQTIVAQKDEQRFKVPIMSSGLNKLIKYELITNED
ncbi:MAG: hypothetical protein M0R03_15475 [Novosphingobium sp.]|nr:hypothetical protein [Novosphingobium sp.]